MSVTNSHIRPARKRKKTLQRFLRHTYEFQLSFTVKISARHDKALLDLGTALTMIDQLIIPSSYLQKVISTNKSLNTANNTPLQIIGEISVKSYLSNLHICNQQLSITTVSTCLTIILGSVFPKQCDITLNS